jgi:PadR family transcriptional regulator, regulatory protein PadR
MVVHFLDSLPPSNKELTPGSQNFGRANCGRFSLASPGPNLPLKRQRALSVLLCDIHSQARQDKTILEARADAPQKKSKKSLTTYTVYNTVCGVHYMTSGISNHALFENLRLELRRGSLVLAVLAALRKEQYGYTLRKTLGEQGMAIDEGTLYPLLRRLESQGLLVSEWREEEKRNKRFYRLSADGKVILKQLLAEWQSINSSLNGML